MELLLFIIIILFGVCLGVYISKLKFTCPECGEKQLVFDHEEPVGRFNTWINVYVCKSCGKEFV